MSRNELIAAECDMVAFDSAPQRNVLLYVNSSSGLLASVPRCVEGVGRRAQRRGRPLTGKDAEEFYVIVVPSSVEVSMFRDRPKGGPG